MITYLFLEYATSSWNAYLQIFLVAKVRSVTCYFVRAMSDNAYRSQAFYLEMFFAVKISSI